LGGEFAGFLGAGVGGGAVGVLEVEREDEEGVKSWR
jgi:hypothetical protein